MSERDWKVEDDPTITQLPSGIEGFYELVTRLKTTRRQGWVRHGIQAESVADHSLAMSLLSFTLPESIDKARVRDLCLVHDLAEAVVGDTTPFDSDRISREEKARRELLTFQYISDHWSWGESLKALWEEFESMDTEESRHAQDIDKLEMMYQAFGYEKAHGKDLGEFMGASRKLKTTFGQTAADSLRRSREEFWSGRHHTLEETLPAETVAKQDDYYR